MVPDLWRVFLDILVAVVVIVEGVRLLQADSLGAAAVALLLGGLAVSIGRRRAPTGALVASALVAVLMPLQTGQHITGWAFLEICLASFATHKPRIRAAVATTAVGLLLVAQSVFSLKASVLDPLTLALVWWTAAAGGVGSAVRYQRRYMRAHQERSASLSKTREADIARLIAEERMRIARELHDVLAHHIAAISVHASSAEANTKTDPDSAVESLVLIRTASGEVISELQAILHVLRSGQPTHDIDAPVAGSTQIPRLVESFRSLGLCINYQEIGGLPLNPSPALDLALYRIVQEALTNAQKYGDGLAWVDLRSASGEIRLLIRNRVAATVPERGSTQADGLEGFGLLGMKERAESAGGELHTVIHDGWFTVEARFPIGAVR